MALKTNALRLKERNVKVANVLDCKAGFNGSRHIFDLATRELETVTDTIQAPRAVLADWSEKRISDCAHIDNNKVCACKRVYAIIRPVAKVVIMTEPLLALGVLDEWQHYVRLCETRFSAGRRIACTGKP